MKIKMKGIYKSYGADNVISNVDFGISDGELCVITGESGAGKSTLINILGGVITPDKGEITIDGAPVRFHDPAEAAEAGIAVVYQEPCRICDLKVYEFIFLGREITKFGILNNQFMKSEAGRILAETGADIDPSAYMADLCESGRQTVNICRIFLSGASLFILDESLDKLPDTIAKRIANMLTGFKIEGKGIILAAKTLKYTWPMGSRIVLMRDGAITGEYAADAGPPEGLLPENKLIYGDPGRFVSRYCVMEVRGDYYSFQVNRGEILGLIGEGFIDVIMRVMGFRKPVYAKIYLHGKTVYIDGPAGAMKLGIAFAPRDRLTNCIFPDMNIMDNIFISAWRHVSKFGFISRFKQESAFEAQAGLLKIKSGYRYNTIRAVPSGSQQKAVLARLLISTPQVIILDNPTQGMGTADRDDIYGLIQRLSGNGASIILYSDSYGEICGISDRALIMRGGRITGELSGAQLAAEEIGSDIL